MDLIEKSQSKQIWNNLTVNKWPNMNFCVNHLLKILQWRTEYGRSVLKQIVSVETSCFSRGWEKEGDTSLIIFFYSQQWPLTPLRAMHSETYLIFHFTFTLLQNDQYHNTNDKRENRCTNSTSAAVIRPTSYFAIAVSTSISVSSPVRAKKIHVFDKIF